MIIVQKPISQIRPYEKNAKLHPKKQIEQIAKSIQTFGFNQPIVVDKNGVIIVGHGRLLGAQSLGMETVPTLTVDITEEEARAYRLADNKLNESDWDMELVIEELKGLSGEMIDLTGFDKDLIIDDDEKEDLAPEAPITPKSRLGDVYELGEQHRVICGDSTSQEAVEALMEGMQADMVFTDPPYNINYKGQGKNTSNTIENDNLDTGDFDAFLDKVFTNYANYLKGGGGDLCFPRFTNAGTI